MAIGIYAGMLSLGETSRPMAGIRKSTWFIFISDNLDFVSLLQ
jgi:hypothetical protein